MYSFSPSLGTFPTLGRICCSFSIPPVHPNNSPLRLTMVGYLVHPSSWDYVNCMHRHLVCPHPDAATAASFARERIQYARKCLQSAQDRYKHFADSTGLHCLRQFVSITCCPASTQYPLAYLELLHIHLCPFQFTQFTTGTSAVTLALPAHHNDTTCTLQCLLCFIVTTMVPALHTIRVESYPYVRLAIHLSGYHS